MSLAPEAAGSWPAIADLLAKPTSPQWVQRACECWQELLVDHANCEKKAASTAIALMFSYPDDRRLAQSMARLAREELRHFEQVDRLMNQLGVTVQRQAPSRYAAGLRSGLSSAEPQRRVDLLLAGALIEARSCERFGLLVPQLSGPIADLYATLRHAEARHYELYLHLAGSPGDPALRTRLQQLAKLEGELATSPDPQFRFHSGTPVQAEAPAVC